MARQRIKRVQPVFTHYNDSNISPLVKQNIIVQNDNKKMNSSRTLWMGNIESWMDESFVLSLFKSISNL